MKLRLYKRHHGIHRFIREEEVPNDLCTVVKKPCKVRGFEYSIDNEKALADKVGLLFYISPKRILLTVGDDSGSTGVFSCKYFMPWAKYFDAYVIEVVPEKHLIKKT